LTPQQKKAVKEFVRAKYLSPLRLRDMALVAGLSPSHFVRAFRESVGVTPHHYLNHHRLKLSQTLLGCGVGSIKEAAVRSGFQDPQQFTRQFKKLYGVTPSYYARAVCKPLAPAAQSQYCRERGGQ